MKNKEEPVAWFNARIAMESYAKDSLGHFLCFRFVSFFFLYLCFFFFFRKQYPVEALLFITMDDSVSCLRSSSDVRVAFSTGANGTRYTAPLIAPRLRIFFIRSFLRLAEDN